MMYPDYHPKNHSNFHTIKRISQSQKNAGAILTKIVKYESQVERLIYIFLYISIMWVILSLMRIDARQKDLQHSIHPFTSNRIKAAEASEMMIKVD